MWQRIALLGSLERAADRPLPFDGPREPCEARALNWQQHELHNALTAEGAKFLKAQGYTGTGRVGKRSPARLRWSEAVRELEAERAKRKLAEFVGG